MIRSMTAFARAESKGREEPWSVEIRSLNHRYFEFSLKTPPFLYAMEERIRAMVQGKLKRGKISVTVSQNNPEGRAEALSLDREAVRFYIAAMNRLKKEFKLSGDLSVKDLLGLPKIFSVEKFAKDPDREWGTLSRILNQALERAIRAKEREGKKLRKDMEARLSLISQAVKRVEKLTARSMTRYRDRLTERLEQLIADKGMDQNRLSLEVAYLAERSDITEEIVRLKSHLGLFRTRMSQSAEIGRELDFLCQEINREVNTLGSKSQLFEISTEVVLMKRELEKIREQVQNIE